MSQADYKLIVVPGSYDDLGAILKKLGYKYQEVGSVDDLSKSNLLKNCKAVFVACGADLSADNKTIKVLREYVKSGGAIYASDLASSLIETLFPKIALFDSSGYDDGIKVDVVDPGLAEIIGKKMNIHHDSEVHGVESVSRDVKVLIRGPRDDDSDDEYPYLITFNYGDGLVIYTVFHNSEQTSATEKKLLNYLIFRPIMSGAASKAAQLVQAQMATPGKEIFASINPGETSARYGVNVTSPINLLFVLSWEENATLGMQVWDPSDKLVKDGAAGKSPLTIEVPASQTGAWTCAVKGQTIPHRNFPYVLTIATRGGKLAAAVSSSAAPAVSAPANLAAKPFPIYLLVDTSSKATDVLNPLLVGLRQFENRLRTRMYRNYLPHISLIAINDSGQVLVKSAEPSRYSTPALNAKGLGALGMALTNVLNDISAHPSEAKPLVITLLAGAPTDSWQGKADQIRALAAQGKANHFVFGMGGYSDAAVFAKLTTSTPLVLPVVTQMYAQQMFDWLYNIADVILSGMESGGGGQRKSVPTPPACLHSVS